MKFIRVHNGGSALPKRRGNALTADSRFVRFAATLASFLLVAMLSIDARATATRIMVFGDSLSAAYNIDPTLGWVALLEKRLQAENLSSTVINASISGETTTGGAARIATDLARHRPTHVVLELGANDGLRGLPIKATRANLDTMIRAIQRAKAKAILIGIQIPPNYGIDYAREFREIFPALAKQYKLPLVPFLLEGIAERRESFLPDGLHPTAESQPHVLENVWPVLKATLQRQ